MLATALIGVVSAPAPPPASAAKKTQPRPFQPAIISRKAVGGVSLYLVMSQNETNYRQLELDADRRRDFGPREAAEFDERAREFFVDHPSRYGRESVWRRLYGDAPGVVREYFPRNACAANGMLIEMSERWVDRALLAEVGFVYFDRDDDIRRQVERLMNEPRRLLAFIGARYASGRIRQAAKALAYVQHLALTHYKRRKSDNNSVPLRQQNASL
jgi:hypothetical protein